MFAKYIDQKTNEGYAAIHFASYKGNLVIFFRFSFEIFNFFKENFDHLRKFRGNP